MLQYYYELAFIYRYILYIATAASAAAHLHITIAPPSHFHGSAIVLARRTSDSNAQHSISSPAAGVPSHPCQEHRAAQIESKNTRVIITVLIICFVLKCRHPHSCTAVPLHSCQHCKSSTIRVYIIFLIIFFVNASIPAAVAPSHPCQHSTEQPHHEYLRFCYILLNVSL